MIYIYNRDEEQIDILDIKPKFTREIGKFNTLEFETIKEYEKGYRVVYQYKGKSYEFIIQEQDYLRDDMVSFSYFCKDSFVENEGVPILDKRPEGSYKVALNSVLEDTRWELVTGSDFSETLTFFNSFYQVSVLEAFAEIVGKYNLEFETSFTFTGSKITSRKIHIKKLGEKANSRLEFGKNIVKFERKILPENIVTALYGYGKGEETESGGYGRRISFADINGGLAYVTNEEARLKYGIGPIGAKKHIFGFFIDEEETDKTKLLESTRKELERVSQPQAEYTIEAVNLHIDCDYADTVPVLDEEINFSGETRIVKAIVEGDDLVFVFGHVVKGFTDSFQKEIQKSAEATEIKITSIMETRLNQIAEVYFGEDGYNYDLKAGNEYNLPAGLYSFDAPIDENPTKVIYFGAGKLLIADSKATDGGWAWKTALDGQGIVGSSIVAHSITANQLASDVGQSLDLSSNTSITMKVKSETQSYIDANKDQLKGADGNTPVIQNGYWYINGVSTGIKAEGTDGTNGTNGTDGTDGATPYIGDNGNWWINEVDTGVQADVGALKTEFESYRTQTDKDIADRVTKTEYSGLTTRVAQAEQKLTPTSITQTVESNTTTLATKADVQTTAENWTATFSQIGGRNLLPNSHIEKTGGSIEYVMYANLTGIFDEHGPGEYTFSFDLKLGVAGDAYVYCLDRNSTEIKYIFPTKRFTATTKYQRYHMTVNVSLNSASATHTSLAFYSAYDTGRIPTVKNIKIEKGSVATDWTPAPEDVQAEMDALAGEIGGVQADVGAIRTEFGSYRTQTDKAITDRVTKTEYSGLTTRVTQAEQKADTNFNHTDGGKQYNNTGDKGGSEANFDSVKLTFDNQQIGGTNLLRNSNFALGLTGWMPWGNSVLTLTNPNVYKVANTGMNTPHGIQTIDEEKYRFQLKGGEEYTISFLGHAVLEDLPSYTYILSSSQGNQPIRSTLKRWGRSPISVLGTVNPAHEYSLTFTCPMDIPDGRLLLGFIMDSTWWYVSHVKLEKGNKWTAWSPHPDELYTGITTIDKDGVTVGKEGETIETNLGFDGLRIKDGATEIASFVGSGAVIRSLQAESISGDVINIMSSSTTFNIGSGTGYYGDFAEVKNAIGNRKHLAYGVTLTINIQSVLNEGILIEGFSGGGMIEVNIYSRVNGYIRTSSNSCVIRVYGKNSTHVLSASGQAIVSSADAHVYLLGLNIDAKDTTNGVGITSQYGSNVYVQNCDIINVKDALYAVTAGKLQAHNNKGNPTRYAAITTDGRIGLGGTVPDGGNYGFVYNFEAITRTPSSFSPPATKTVSETRTFYQTDIYTYSVKYGARSTHYGKAAAQNRYDTSMTQMKGRITFGSSVYSFIAGRNSGTTPTVKIRLRRQNSSHGASSSVKPTPEWSGAPSFGGATRGNWTPWVTIPYTIFTSSGYTFSFYNGSTGSSYAIWDRAEIQITRTVTQ